MTEMGYNRKAATAATNGRSRRGNRSFKATLRRRRVAPIPAHTPGCGAVKREKGPPVIGVLPASRGRLLGWWAGRWLSRPGNAIDLVRQTVGRGSWATIG